MGDDSLAELEKELGLALVEQVNSSSASALSSPRPRSLEAQQDEIKSRELTETTSSTLEEPRDACPYGTLAQELEGSSGRLRWWLRYANNYEIN
jgi:hypothetical protein